MLQSCSSSDSDNNTNTTSVTDADGNVYQKVTICDQTWTQSNLNVSKYRNGDVIPQVTDPTEWANLTTGAWCYYNNDSANGAIYGKLYNWYAVNDPRGLAPAGWHIPTDAEWTQLTDCLGGISVAGGKMKATGTSLWQSPNAAATNESGFTGLPGGYRDIGGQYDDIGNGGFWWISSESGTTNAFLRILYYTWGEASSDTVDKTSGFSVRCLED